MKKVYLLNTAETQAAESVIEAHLADTFSAIDALRGEPIQRRWLIADAVRYLLANLPADPAPLVMRYYAADKGAKTSIFIEDALDADMIRLGERLQAALTGRAARLLEARGGDGFNPQVIGYVALLYRAAALEEEVNA